MGGKCVLYLFMCLKGLQWTEDLKALFGNRRGQIFLFDFRKPEVATPVEIIGGLDMKSFNPHGMSIWNDGQGILKKNVNFSFFSNFLVKILWVASLIH